MLDMKLSMGCIKQIQSNYRKYFYNSEIFYCKDTMLYHHKKEYYHDAIPFFERDFHESLVWQQDINC